MKDFVEFIVSMFLFVLMILILPANVATFLMVASIVFSVFLLASTPWLKKKADARIAKITIGGYVVDVIKDLALPPKKVVSVKTVEGEIKTYDFEYRALRLVFKNGYLISTTCGEK